MGCVRAIAAACQTLTIEAASLGEEGLPMSCAALIAPTIEGHGARERWRRLYADRTADVYGTIPPGLDLKGILSFFCDIVATPAVLAIEHGPWLLDLAPSRVSFSLAPGWAYPDRIRLFRGNFAIEPDASQRWRLAYAAYQEQALLFAQRCAPDAALSSQQRRGVVEDAWHLALARARGQSTATVQRQACCLIYALPGAHECAGCPRLTGKSALHG